VVSTASSVRDGEYQCLELHIQESGTKPSPSALNLMQACSLPRRAELFDGSTATILTVRFSPKELGGSLEGAPLRSLPQKSLSRRHVVQISELFAGSDLGLCGFAN